MTKAIHHPGRGGQRSECAKREQRVYPRLRCKGTVELRVLPVGGVIVGSLIDLSKKGCCILSNEPLPAFEHSHAEVHLKLNGMSLRLAGVVRHIHGRTKVGIEFLNISARKAAQIDELMAEVVQMNRTAAWQQPRTQERKSD